MLSILCIAFVAGWERTRTSPAGRGGARATAKQSLVTFPMPTSAQQDLVKAASPTPADPRGKATIPDDVAADRAARFAAWAFVA